MHKERSRDFKVEDNASILTANISASNYDSKIKDWWFGCRGIELDTIFVFVSSDVVQKMYQGFEVWLSRDSVESGEFSNSKMTYNSCV